MKKFLISGALAFSLTLAMSTSNVWAETTWSTHVDLHDDGGSTVYHIATDDEGGEDIFYVEYDADGDVVGVGNPSPDDDSSSGLVDHEALIDEMMKHGGGGGYEAEEEFFETWFGKQLNEHGKGGSIVPVHNPSDGLAYDHEGGGGGGGGGGWDPMDGGFDPTRHHGSSSDDDDDKDDNPPPPNHGETFPGPPELVNPVPVDQLQTLAAETFPRTFTTITR